jgi:hypothetical protein
MNGDYRFKKHLQPIGESPFKHQATDYDALVVVFILDGFIGVLLVDGTSGGQRNYG